MKEIPLTQNQFALVDNEDYLLLMKHKWHTNKNKNTYYAKHDYWDKKTKKIKSIKMHRLVMGITNPKIQIDHINGNGLDNRKNNLRICTYSQQKMNQKKLQTRKCSSEYKGVNWHKKSKKWQSRISINNKRKHLGLFNNEIKAAEAYDAAAKKYFGEFARLNFP